MSDKARTWREILAEAASQFLTTRPSDAKEWFRRLAVVVFLSFAAVSAFTLVRYPEWISVLSPKPIIERDIETRIAESSGMLEKLTDELEAWFYSHRPYGLMLISWHDLNQLSGIWLRPKGVFTEKEGHHTLTPDMRLLTGSFIFGDCTNIPFDRSPGKILVACPIYNSHDVWGYVAAVIDPEEIEVDYALRSIMSLASRITSFLYDD